MSGFFGIEELRPCEVLFDIRSLQPQRSSFAIASGRLVEQPKVDQLEIGALVFRCPTTRQDIESGIEMDQCTFLKSGQLGVCVHCPACRNCHEFNIASGRLAPFRAVHLPNGNTEYGLSPSRVATQKLCDSKSMNRKVTRWKSLWTLKSAPMSLPSSAHRVSSPSWSGSYVG